MKPQTENIFFEIRFSQNEIRKRKTNFSKIENQLSKSESENEIQNFLKPKINFQNSIFQNPNPKRKYKFQNCLEPKIENRFSKSESEIKQLFGTKIRKSIFDVRLERNEIRNMNFLNQEFENRFSKNEIRNLRFPKFKNRFENSESALGMMNYKNSKIQNQTRK